jgi:hypothetical protein
MDSDGDAPEATRRCQIRACHRHTVVVFQFTPGDADAFFQERQVCLCLPCRRALDLGDEVPGSDWSELWLDKTSASEFGSFDRPDTGDVFRRDDGGDDGSR